MTEQVFGVRFLDLSVRYEDERIAIKEAIESLMDSGRFIISDVHDEFEKELACIHSRSFAVGVNSGTDALTIGLRLLNLPKGSKVLTSAFSWLASATSILLSGNQPYFVDCDESLQLDLDIVESILSRQSEPYSAILIPHLHGNVSDLERIEDIRVKYGVKIIEDCAQAFGAKDRSGRLAGTVGDVSAFSFNPMKVLGGFGDGGAILFDEPTLLERAKLLRHSGSLGSLQCGAELSTNCRLDAIQSKILFTRLRFFRKHRDHRESIYRSYDIAFKEFAPLLRPITRSGENSNHYCYQIICDNRDDLIGHLNQSHIETRIRHNFIIPDLPVFERFNSGNFPVARSLVSRSLCLPIHNNMASSDVSKVIECVSSFFKNWRGKIA